MGEIRELHDVKQYPGRYGVLTDLEIRVANIEKRFTDIYEREFIDNHGMHAWGFRTPHGTRFIVNAIYEWQAVFLEYDDDDGGDDGDMVYMEDSDEEQMFLELHEEILITEEDDLRALENAYRIYKTERCEDGLKIHFRFWDDRQEVIDALYSHQKVMIDDVTYHYEKYADSIQAVIVRGQPEAGDLYDHWIQFV